MAIIHRPSHFHFRHSPRIHPGVFFAKITPGNILECLGNISSEISQFLLESVYWYLRLAMQSVGSISFVISLDVGGQGCEKYEDTFLQQNKRIFM